MRISLRESSGSMPVLEGHLTALDRAVAHLRDRNPELTRILELRMFAGMTVAHAADALDLSPRLTAERWREAKHRFLESLESQRQA